jgi:hypothetical protein
LFITIPLLYAHLGNIKTTKTMTQKEIITAAKNAGYNYKIEAGEVSVWIGVEISAGIWSWWKNYGGENDDCFYRESYSQRTGKSCKNFSRGMKKEERLQKFLPKEKDLSDFITY